MADIKILSIKNNEITTKGELIEYPLTIMGGRNFLKQSASFDLIANADSANSSFQKGSDGTGNWITGIHTASNKFYLNTTISVLLTDTNHYPYSLASVQRVESVEVMCPYSIEVSLSQGNYTTLSPNTWTRLSRVVTTGNRQSGIYTGNVGSAPSNTKLYYRNWKVEKGGILTPWTQAPEDIDLSYPESVVSFVPTLNENRVMSSEFNESGTIAFLGNKITAGKFIENNSL